MEINDDVPPGPLLQAAAALQGPEAAARAPAVPYIYIYIYIEREREIDTTIVVIRSYVILSQ